jgi:hypothetical protein
VNQAHDSKIMIDVLCRRSLDELRLGLSRSVTGYEAYSRRIPAWDARMDLWGQVQDVDERSILSEDAGDCIVVDTGSWRG